jgi:O-antigen ligase
MVGPIYFFAHGDIQARVGGIFFFGLFGALAGLGAVASFVGLICASVKREKVIYVLSMALFLLFLVMSDLRTGEFAVAISFLVGYSVSTHRPRWLKAGFRVFFVALVFYGAFLIMSPSVPIIESGNVENDLVWRTLVWDLSITGIASRPFTGFGGENYLKGNLEGVVLDGNLADPHSSYLSLILQYGFISLVLFAIVYGGIVYRLFRQAAEGMKVFVCVAIYWALVSSTGGTYFNGTSGFGQIMFEFSFLGLLCHPQLRSSRETTT